MRGPKLQNLVMTGKSMEKKKGMSKAKKKYLIKQAAWKKKSIWTEQKHQGPPAPFKDIKPQFKNEWIVRKLV